MSSALLFRENSRHRQGNQQHRQRNAHPAEAVFIQRQRVTEGAEDAQRQVQCVQRVQHADDARPGDNNRVDIAVLRPHAVRHAQQNQHNRNRIDGVQNRDGNAQNDRQTQIANQEGKANNEKDPLAVADAGEKVREILRDGVNQPDTRRQAGEREDGGEQISAGFAEELEDNAPQRPRAVLLNVVHAGGAHAHVAGIM